MSQVLQECVQMVVLLCTLHVLCTVNPFMRYTSFPRIIGKRRDIGIKIENAYMQAITCVDSVWCAIVHIRAEQTRAKTQAKSRSVL